MNKKILIIKKYWYIFFIIFTILFVSCFENKTTDQKQSNYPVISLEEIGNLYTRWAIRDYVIEKTLQDIILIQNLAREEENIPEYFSFLIAHARNLYKDYNMLVPKTINMVEVLELFSREIFDFIETKYFEKVFSQLPRQNQTIRLVLQADMIRLQENSWRKLTSEDINSAMQRTLDVLNYRITSFGFNVKNIQKQEDDQILIEIFGDAFTIFDNIEYIIMNKGNITFQIVDDDATEAFNNYYRANTVTTFDASGKLLDPTIVPSDVIILGVYTKDKFGLYEQLRHWDGHMQYIAVKREIGINGYYINEASVELDYVINQPLLFFKLNLEGREIFSHLTSSNIGNRLAIILDERVRSSPTIFSVIYESAQINGFTIDEAEKIAFILRTAALPVYLEVLEAMML